MRKILLLFVVLGGIIYLSGCGDEKNCTCITTYYDDNNNVIRTEESATTVPEDKNCDGLDGPGYNSATGEEWYYACVGNH